ncbi:MAG: AraC family transcriptional regulator, partial [Gammaproteobacteria bacterium]
MTIPYRVAILLSENILATAATLPMEILSTAEGAARGQNRHARPIDIQTVSLSGNPVTTSSGFQLAPSAALEDIGECDLVHIPGLWR